MSKRAGLGRGIGALIPTGPPVVASQARSPARRIPGVPWDGPPTVTAL